MVSKRLADVPVPVLDVCRLRRRPDSPYPRYARIRSRTPVLQVARHGGRNVYVVSRYEDIERLFRNTLLSKCNVINGLNTINNDRVRGELVDLVSAHPNMLQCDAPAHTRLRRHASKAISAKKIRSFEPRVRQLVHGLVSRLPDRGTVEVTSSLAEPLPILVIASLLGVPEKDHHRLKEWSETIAPLADGFHFVRDVRRIQCAVIELNEYLFRLVAHKTTSPSDDVISALLGAQDRLTDGEIVSTIQLLILAGHLTSTNFIASAIHAIATRPNVVERLRTRPQDIPRVVEEVLRFESPVQVTGYITTRDMELHDTRIPHDSYLALLIGSANRDPDCFNDPDTFDTDRPPGRHLAFGGGIHFCLGAALARLEGRLLLEHLFERFATIRLTVPAPTVRASDTFRGFSHLFVHLQARA